MSEEKRFDWELTEQLADFDMTTLPEEERVEPTPWQHLAGKLVWGVIFSTITLNFLYLNVILPAIGMIWLVQAFRPLRRENGWLRLCHGLAWALCAARLCTLTVQGTLLPETEAFTSLERPVGLVLAAMWLALYFSLWRGLLAIARRGGQEQPSAPGAAMLMVWYGALTALALAGPEQVSGLAFVLLLLLYFLILRSLRKTLRFFEENGYTLQPLPSRVSDGRLTALWLAIVALTIALALTFGTRHSMDWQVRPANEQVGCEEIVENLRTLGLPEDMAADLTSEELAALAGAQRVLLGRSERFDTNDGGKLLCRSAAIQLPGAERWVLLQHFAWQEMPRHRSTEALRITLPYEEELPSHVPPFYAADEALPARMRLLYDEGGQTFTVSPVLEPMAAVSWMGREYTDRCAAWSLPRRGEAARGYLLYGLYRLDDASIVTVSDYVHQQLAVYPALSARQHSASGFWEWGLDAKFRTMQYQMYFHYDNL